MVPHAQPCGRRRRHGRRTWRGSGRRSQHVNRWAGTKRRLCRRLLLQAVGVWEGPIAAACCVRCSLLAATLCLLSLLRDLHGLSARFPFRRPRPLRTTRRCITRCWLIGELVLHSRGQRRQRADVLPRIPAAGGAAVAAARELWQ